MLPESRAALWVKTKFNWCSFVLDSVTRYKPLLASVGALAVAVSTGHEAIRESFLVEVEPVFVGFRKRWIVGSHGLNRLEGKIVR